MTVRVTPRGGSDHVDGVGESGELLVRVRPAAAEGAANKAVVKLLADELKMPNSAVAVVRGARSRTKLIALDDADPGAVARRWPGLRLEGG